MENNTTNEQDELFGNRPNNGNEGHKSRFDEKNYLNTTLKPGETKRTVTIRILPESLESKKIAIPIQIHPMKNLDKSIAQKGFKAFICLNDEHIEDHDTRGCPICNHSKELFEEANLYKDPNNDVCKGMTDEERTKKYKELCKEAFNYESKTCYIVRVIERGKENEGVKFWRFNERTDGGYRQVLTDLYKQRDAESMQYKNEHLNIFDVHNGHDIVLTITLVGDSKRTEINISDVSFSTPLSTDEKQIIEWVNDAKTWKDVYSVKHYDYLDIITHGGVPVWDNENHKYIIKQPEATTTETTQTTTIYESQPAPIPTPTPSVMEDTSDELPF